MSQPRASASCPRDSWARHVLAASCRARHGCSSNALGERGAQVVHLGVEPRRRFEDDGHTAVGIVTRRLLRVPGPMALDACRQLTSITELSLGVLPHHLEHAEAGGLRPSSRPSPGTCRRDD